MYPYSLSMHSVLMFILCYTGIWHCYWEYSNLKGKPGSDGTITDIGFNTNVKVYLQLRETWLAFSEYTARLPAFYAFLYAGVFSKPSGDWTVKAVG